MVDPSGMSLDGVDVSGTGFSVLDMEIGVGAAGEVLEVAVTSDSDEEPRRCWGDDWEAN